MIGNLTRGQRDLARLALEGLRRDFRRHLDGFTALETGEGIGITGIDDDAARFSTRENGPAPVDRRRRAL